MSDIEDILDEEDYNDLWDTRRILGLASYTPILAVLEEKLLFAVSGYVNPAHDEETTTVCVQILTNMLVARRKQREELGRLVGGDA